MVTMKIDKTKPVAVVSGGLGHLGSAIGRELAHNGFSVALLHCNPSKTGTEKSEEFAALSVGLYQCDITDQKKVCEVLLQIEKELGPIVVGIHAAHSPLVRKNVSEVDITTFEKQFTVGVFGGFNFLSEIALLMKSRKDGILIGITTSAIEQDPSEDSFAGYIAAKSALVGGYVAAKYALKGLLKEFAQTLKEDNIRVYAVAPGFLAGGLNADLPPRLFEFLKEKAPNGQITEATDVAQAVASLILCERDARLDGLTLLVDQLSLGED